MRKAVLLFAPLLGIATPATVAAAQTGAPPPLAYDAPPPPDYDADRDAYERDHFNSAQDYRNYAQDRAVDSRDSYERARDQYYRDRENYERSRDAYYRSRDSYYRDYDQASAPPPAPPPAYVGQTWRGEDGRTYCRRSDGTTGLIIGGAGGALIGRAIDGGRHRAVGTILGLGAGALLGRSVDQHAAECR